MTKAEVLAKIEEFRAFIAQPEQKPEQEKKWTDKDMEEAFEQGCDYGNDKNRYNSFEVWIKKYRTKTIS